jgi:C-terminal processing protease CtpA/Prc
MDKPVAVLTNRGSFSATEWFVLFMQLQANVTIVGDTTGGGGAVPISRELPNGWILRVSNTQTKLASGKVFQKSGIAPDVPVWITESDEQKNVDTILESAIALLK